jgi:regulatory protein
VARRILLARLTDQPRTRSELAGFLAAKNVPDDVAARLLDRFTEVGLIDDAAYARAWISSRLTGRGLARRALASELRRKGVPDEIAREALDEIDPDDEVEAAHRLVRRKLPGMARLPPDVRTRRLVAMLARKGFPAGVAFAVVRSELAEASELVECLEPPDGG